MATIKELLSAMIDKINGNEDKIDNIKGVPEAFDSITMTNGTDTANLTMNAEKELLFDGEPVGGNSGGGGVTSWNDLTDKPFYKEEGGKVDILPESAPVFMGDSIFVIANIDGVLQGGSIPTADIVVGEQYTVMWNGVEYEADAVEMEMIMPDAPVLINKGANLETGEGAIFVIQLSSIGVENDGTIIYGIIGALDGSQLVTLSVYQGKEIIHHLDSEYIKDMYYEKQEARDFLNYSGNLGKDNDYVYINIVGGSVPLVLGETYDVVIDGVEYLNCPTVETIAFGYPAIGIEITNDNGVNYKIGSSPELGEAFGTGPNTYFLFIMDESISTDTEEITASFKVSGIKTVIKEIDQKFLPNTSATVEYVGTTVETAKTELQTNIDGKLSIEEMDTGLEKLVPVCSGYGYNNATRPLFLGVINTGSNKGIYYSSDGVSWTLAEGTKTYTFNDIIYARISDTVIFVAVGINVVAYSADGINWTLNTNIHQVEYKSVCRYSTGVVAVGASGAILYSNDGITWTKAESPVTTDLVSVCYGNSKLIAISLESTTALVSEDKGITWNTIELPIAPKPYNATRKAKICYGNDTYVYTGDGKYIVYSYNGVEWHSIDFEAGHEDTILEISFLGGKFLLESWLGTLYYSDDVACDKWTISTFYGGNGVNTIRYDLNSRTIYGYSEPIKSNVYLVKSTRSTKVMMTPDLENVIESFVFKDGIPVPLESFKFLGIDVLKSEQQKAITLSEPTTILFNRSMTALYLVDEVIHKVISKGSTNLAITNSKLVYASPDGLEWSKFYDSSGFKDVCFGENENIIVLKLSGSFYYTEDGGKNWITYSNNGIQLIGDGVLYHNGLYISHNKSYSQISSIINILSIEDSSISTKSLDFYHKNMCSNGNRLLALDVYGKLHYSDNNGDSWTDCSCDTSCEKICYVNDKFMAIDTYGYIYYSTDGISWSKAVIPFAVELSTVDHNIEYYGGKYIYLGYDNTPTISSIDGINWSVEKLIPYGSYTNLYYVNGVYVVNDSDGNYIYSIDGAQWKFNTRLEQNGNDVTNTVTNLVKIECNNVLPKGSSLMQVVNLTIDEATGTIISEKSASEILAMNQTSPVCIFFNGAYAMFSNNDDDGNVSFSSTVLMDSQLIVSNITIHEDKSCVLKTATLQVTVTEM